ncbi:MAG: right-handed parallel beta-helix repeat-containing protein [Geminicoccaceae bacterium]
MPVSKKRDARLRPAGMTWVVPLVVGFMLTVLAAGRADALPINLFQHLDHSPKTASITHAVVTGEQKAGLVLVASSAAQYKKSAEYFLKKAKTAKAKGKKSDYSKYIAKYKASWSKYKKSLGSSSKTAASTSSNASYLKKKADAALKTAKKYKKGSYKYKKYYTQYQTLLKKYKNLASKTASSASTSSSKLSGTQKKKYDYYMKKAAEALAKAKKQKAGSTKYKEYMKIYTNQLARANDIAGKVGAASVAKGQSGKKWSVRSSSELHHALAQAASGSTIELASGTYSGTFRAYVSNISIVGKGKVKFAGILDIQRVSNVDVSNVEFVGSRFEAIHVASAKGIRIANCAINMGKADYGIRVHASSNVEITNCVFKGKFNHAVSAKDSVHSMKVKNNDFPECGTKCVEAGQTPDGVRRRDETSTGIEISGNNFGSAQRCVVVANVRDAKVTGNKFGRGCRIALNTMYGSVGSKTKGSLGQWGMEPQKVDISGNTFASAIILAGRGAKGDTMSLKGNRGSVSCSVRNVETLGSALNKLTNWSSVYRGQPNVNQSGNSFKCS